MADEGMWQQQDRVLLPGFSHELGECQRTNILRHKGGNDVALVSQVFGGQGHRELRHETGGRRLKSVGPLQRIVIRKNDEIELILPGSL